MSDDVLELGGARYLPIPIRPAPAPAPEHSSENALAQDRSSSSSNVYEQILAGIEAKQRAPLHEQIEAAGWGFTHSTALTAFVLFVVSEAMEVTVPNVVWDKSIGESTFGTEGHSDTFRSVVTSAPMLGHVLGGLLGGVVADTRGRRAAIYLHSMLFVLASLASAFSRSETCFVLSRAALGLSLGIILPVVVSYMAELAPSSHRARAVVVIPGFGFPCGQILMLMFGLLLHSSEAKDGDDAGLEWWRALLVAGVVPNLLALCLVVMFVPESPHFLLSVGRRADAEEVLQQIAKANSSEHRLIHDGRISLERDSPARTALHGAVATIGGCADAGSAGLRGAELATGFELPESRVQRWKRQALELLSPPLHSYMLSILAMWSFVSFGQLGADVILPEVLQTALDLDMQGRLTALLCITICAWPGFLLTLFALDYRAVTSSRRAVCLGMAAASCGAALLAGVWVQAGALPMMVSSTLLKMVSHGTIQAMDLYATESLPSSHRATGLAVANSLSKLVGVLVSFFSLTELGGVGGFDASLHYFAFAAAFAGGVCVVMMSPEMGDDRQLILDFDELCAVHEQRCLGGKGESTPLLSDGGEKKH